MTGPKRDDELSHAIGWIVAVLLAIVMLGMLALTSFQDVACIGTEGKCIREWIAALSGWAAAAAAATTIAVLYGQLKHQQRQTDFALGDSLPAAFATDYEAELAEIRIRLVNWNRRPFLLSHIVGQNIDKKLTVQFLKYSVCGEDSRSNYTLSDDGALRNKVFVPGWENRAGPVPDAVLTVQVSTKVDDSALAQRHVVTFELHGNLLDQTHHPVVIRATGDVLTY